MAIGQQLGRAFSTGVVRREIDAITSLEEAKRAAHLLLQQIEVQRQAMDLLIRMDWDSNDVI